MLTQINSDPIQYFTTDSSDLSLIAEPNIVESKMIRHNKLFHDFNNPTTPTNETSSAPYSTTTTTKYTQTYVITLT